jgi:GcrA cell cycle regulator
MSASPSVQWKPEWIESLRSHLAAGLSGSQAATEVNSEFGTAFSRCAAIGKANRAKIPMVKRKSGPKPKPKTAKPKRTRRPDVPHSKPRTERKLFTPRPDPRPGMVPLLELAVDGCRWPSGEGPAMLFCNQPQHEGFPYCGSHAAMAYQPARPSSSSTRPSYRHRGRA